MKKTTTLIKEKNICEIIMIINDIALIRSASLVGLMNIKTHHFIKEMDYFKYFYDLATQFFILTKKCDEKNFIWIYDAQKEKMLVEGLEENRIYDIDYNLVAIKNFDEKKHLFGKYFYRNNPDILAYSLDNVEEIRDRYSNRYFILTKGMKKGLLSYSNAETYLIDDFEFDHIEKISNAFIYTKDNKKFFAIDRNNNEKQGPFDELNIQENMIYAMDKNTIYVYNLRSSKLLLTTDYEPELVAHSTYADRCENFFFLIKNQDKVGLLMASLNKQMLFSKPRVTNILEPIYDNIRYKDKCFYVEKDRKMGIYYTYFYDLKWDKILYLMKDYFAFYHNDVCDIKNVSKNEENSSVIENCKIKEVLENEIIYERNNFLGLLLTHEFGERIIPPIYDNITHLFGEYYLVEQRGKKGIIYLEEIIIPMDYQDINIHKAFDIIYFALKKANGDYFLLERKNYNNSSTRFFVNKSLIKIDLYQDVMVLKDDVYLDIYNYKGKKLKTFFSNTEVLPILKNEINGDKEYYYLIDGVYYFYKMETFEELWLEENDFLVTTYETKELVYEIKTKDRNEHDLFCNLLDTKEEIEALNSLKQMVEDERILRKKFPTLSLRKINKS